MNDEELAGGAQPLGEASPPPPSDPKPVAEADRVESLDVLRGFALLGILPLNILGFGMHSAAYFNPAIGLAPEIRGLELGLWAFVELFFEGAMRCLFSMLFGAGVVLFATGPRAKSGWLHYRRTFWLLMFGLFDAYILLWSGDILVLYALAGAVLYWFRNRSPRTLIVLSALLFLGMSLLGVGAQFGLGAMQRAAEEVAASCDPETLSDQTRGMATGWKEFEKGIQPTPEEIASELDQRRQSYVSALRWNAGYFTKQLVQAVPIFLFWDALAMMLLGMAFFKLDVLQAARPRRFFVRMAVVGLVVGLLTNAWEIYGVLSTELATLSVFSPMRPTYQLGRIGVACGYLALIALSIQAGKLPGFRKLLAPVGRMALTNYLMHSLICLFLFTGAGFALVGELHRWQLDLVVLGIWALQIVLSSWWLARFRFGPAEWLWRALTYFRLPPMRRA